MLSRKCWYITLLLVLFDNLACFSNLSLLSEEALTEQDKVNGNNYIEDHDITDVTDEYEADKGPEDSYKGPDIPENSDAFGPDVLSDVHTSDANNDEVHESPKEEENENSLEAIMAKRLGKGEGWNALKKTLKANKADILDMVSKYSILCKRTFGIPKQYIYDR